MLSVRWLALAICVVGLYKWYVSYQLDAHWDSTDRVAMILVFIVILLGHTAGVICKERESVYMARALLIGASLGLMIWFYSLVIGLRVNDIVFVPLFALLFVSDVAMIVDLLLRHRDLMKRRVP